VSSPSEGIRDLLVAANVGVFNATSGWSIHISRMPNKPDTCITIYDSGGAPSNPKWLLDFPTVQVRVRGSENGYLAAQAKCKDIVDALLGLPSQDVNGDRWVMITQLSAPTFLGYEDNKRPQFSINFQLTIEPASGTNREPL
jgi:hypothetical protein